MDLIFVMSKEIRILDNLAAVAEKYGLGTIRNGGRSHFPYLPLFKMAGEKFSRRITQKGGEVLPKESPSCACIVG